MPTKVRVTGDEAELKTGFASLVDRIKAEFDKGEYQVELDFPVGCHGEGRFLYPCVWTSTQELIFGDERVNIAPASVLAECLRQAGYPSSWAYGDSVPSIRLTKVREDRQTAA